MPETLAEGEAGGDGESDRPLLQGEGQQGGEDEDPDQLGGDISRLCSHSSSSYITLRAFLALRWFFMT